MKAFGLGILFQEIKEQQKNITQTTGKYFYRVHEGELNNDGFNTLKFNGRIAYNWLSTE